MKLPPFGQITPANKDDVLATFNGFAKDYFDQALSFITYSEVSDEIFTWGDYPAPTDPTADGFRINEIQNTVLAQQPLQSPAFMLSPVEIGEPGKVFFTGGPEIAAMLAAPPPKADPMTGAVVPVPSLIQFDPQEIGDTIDPVTGKLVPQQPLGRLKASALRELVDRGVLEPQDMAEVNDETTTRLMQQVFDLMWARSRTESDINEFWLAKSVHGFKFALVGFNDEEKRHELQMLSLRQVFMDPTKSRIDKTQYVGVLLPMYRDEAKRRFPKFATQIDADNESINTPKSPLSEMVMPAAYDRQFAAEMCVMFVAYVCDQDIPLAPEMVEDYGISVAQLPTGQQEPVLDQMGMPTVDPTGNPVVADVLREAYVDQKGTEVTYGGPGWPTHKAIRQITYVDSTFVEDKECEMWGIPVLLCQNIPIIDKPFGLGEPIKLLASQRSLEYVLESIRLNTGQYRAPTLHVPTSTHEAMKRAGLKLHTEPGGIIVYEDDVWANMGGQPPRPTMPPAIPESLIQAEVIFRKTLHEDSDRSEVARGQMPSANASGRSIGLLLGANQQSIDVKGRSMREACYRLGMLQLENICLRMTVDDLYKIISKYPKSVLRAFKNWADNVEWNITAAVDMGGSSMKVTQQQNEMAKFGQGLQSKETTQIALNVDPNLESQREEMAARRLIRQQMQLQAMMPQPPAAPPGKPGQPGQPGAGNAPPKPASQQPTPGA